MAISLTRVVGIGSCCFLVLALLVLAPLNATAAETIKIGLVDAKSGPMEYNGRFFYAAAQFAVDAQNSKGGLFGKKLEILWEDSEWKPDTATRKAKKLIMEDKVNIISSGSGSAVGIALNKVAEHDKTLFLNTGGSSDEVQGGKEFSRYGFRVTNASYNITAAMIHFLATKPYRKFYIIGPDFVYGYAVARVSKELIKTHIPDAKILGEDFPPLRTKDFGPYITKIVAAKPDAIISAFFPPDLQNFVKTARSMGLKSNIPILTHIGEPYVINELKEDGVGLYVSQGYSLTVKTPENEQFLKKWHEIHKNDKDYLTWWPFGWCGMAAIGWNMMFAAIEKAGSIDPEKVIEAFEGFQYKSPVGLWTMRKCDHSVILPMFITAIVSGSNPFFNGSIRADVKFPWEGPAQIIPAEKVTLPATPEHNPRCR